MKTDPAGTVQAGTLPKPLPPRPGRGGAGLLDLIPFRGVVGILKHSASSLFRGGAGLAACAAFFLAGCQSPQGLKYQVSGLQIAPAGNAPQAPKITMGIHSFSTPDPPDAGPGINRVQIRGWGINHTATITHGPVGEQMHKAGDTLPKSLEVLHGQQNQPTIIPRPNAPAALPE